MEAYGRTPGFSLAELLVTIAVASILLAIAAPSFSAMIVSNRLAAQVNDIVAAIGLARSEAVKLNGSVSLCRAASASATNCADQADAWEHWIVRSGTGTIVRRGVISTYGGSVAVRSNLTGDELAFGPDGLARTGGDLVSDHRITLCASNARAANIRHVALSAGGRISTSSAEGSCS